MSAHDPKLVALQGLPLFSSCDRKAVRAAARHLDEAEAPTGQVLVHQGRVPAQFLIVVDGRAHLRRDGGVVGELRRGDSFGAALVLGQRPSPVEVAAATALRVLACDPRSLQLLLDEVPVLARHLLERSCEPAELVAS